MHRTTGLRLVVHRLVVHRLVVHRRSWRSLLLVHWLTGFQEPVRASKGTMLRSTADQRQPSSRRRQPSAQGWVRIPPPTVLLQVQLTALLPLLRMLREQGRQEARKVGRKEDLRADLWEDHSVDRSVGRRVDRSVGRKGGRSGGLRGDRSVGHWAALWWVQARKRAVLVSPQRVKVVRCHQTLRRACHRVGLVRLHHGTVLQKFSVSPCIHPYRPHGAA